MAYSTSEEDLDPDSEYDSDPEIQTIYTSQPIIAPLTNPTPIAQMWNRTQYKIQQTEGYY